MRNTEVKVKCIVLDLIQVAVFHDKLMKIPHLSL